MKIINLLALINFVFGAVDLSKAVFEFAEDVPLLVKPPSKITFSTRAMPDSFQNSAGARLSAARRRIFNLQNQFIQPVKSRKASYTSLPSLSLALPASEVETSIERQAVLELKPALAPALASNIEPHHFKLDDSLHQALAILGPTANFIPDSNPIKEPVKKIITALEEIDKSTGLATFGKDLHTQSRRLLRHLKTTHPLETADAIANTIGSAVALIPNSPAQKLMCGAIMCVKVAAAIRRSHGIVELEKEVQEALVSGLKMIKM